MLRRFYYYCNFIFRACVMGIKCLVKRAGTGPNFSLLNKILWYISILFLDLYMWPRVCLRNMFIFLIFWKCKLRVPYFDNKKTKKEIFSGIFILLFWYNLVIRHTLTPVYFFYIFLILFCYTKRMLKCIKVAVELTERIIRNYIQEDETYINRCLKNPT